MILLIHGDDIIKVEKKFSELLDKNTPKIEFDLKKNTLEEIFDSLHADTLFSEKKIITLRNLKSLHHTKRKKLFEKIKEFKNDEFTNIILTEFSTLDKKLTTLADADILYTYELPKYFFQYLDCLFPQNNNMAHNLLQKLKSTNDGEQLFYATVNRTRTLLLFKTKNPQDFDDINKMSSFFKSKLQVQSAKWTDNKLTEFYAALFEIELGLKTSTLPLSVAEHLDMTLFKHLK